MSWPGRYELAALGGIEVGRFDPKRPANSPDWGKLRCVKTGTLRSPDGELVEFKAGRTRVAPGYWAARQRPEWFMPGDKRDQATAGEHVRALEHARQDLERGRPTRTSTRSGVLPPRTGASTLRLPRTAGPRPLSLPR